MCALIDYITAILARLINQTASGDYWLTNVLAALVARTVKLKVLLLDIVSSVAISASAGEDALENSGSYSTSLADDEEECEEDLRIIDADTKGDSRLKWRTPSVPTVSARTSQ